MNEKIDHTGRVIEYLDSGDLRIALVDRQSGERLQVTEPGGKKRRVALKNVLVVHRIDVEPGGFARIAAELEERIAAARREVDTELLWESVRGETRDFSLEELAESYFGDAGAVHVSAIFRAALGDPARFRFRARRFTPRTPEQVEEQLAALRARRERREQRQRAVAWISSLLESGGEALPPPAELEGPLGALEAFVHRGERSAVVDWLAEVRSKLEPLELAFEILRRAGRLPADADPRLVLSRVRVAFPPNVLEEAERLEPFSAAGAERSAGRRDFTRLEAIAIDDEDTSEVDDALTVEPIDGGVRVGIHIADVASFVGKNSSLDREAARRGATLYLPYRSVPMLPEHLSFDLASLQPGAVRPAMSVVAEFSAGGVLGSWEIGPSVVRIARRLTYEEADALLEAPGEGEPQTDAAAALAALFPIAEALEEERRRRGALTIRRPELKVTVAGGDIAVKVIDGSTPSRRIVSEMMILANHLSATYASSHGLPIIYRVQDPPAEPIEQPESYDPVALDAIFRQLSRSRLSLEPQRHAALGLDAYTQLTSPLRRYQDLVIQRQLAAQLAGEPAPYDPQELLEVLATAQAAEAANRDIEGDTVREFTLRYLRDTLAGEGGVLGEATVVAPLTGGYLAELERLPVRGKLLAGGDIELGTRLPVRITHVQPEQGTLLLEPAGAAESP